MDEKKYSQLYQALLQEVLQFHSGNQRRIRKGMLSLLLVPLAFLVLLFLSDGSRVIFLLLWIVSMFGIAAYLIAVEYVDYEMQNKVKKITQKEVELDQLMALPTGMPQLLPHLRGRSQESEAAPEEPAPEEECPARSGEPEEKAVPVPGPEAAQPQDGGAFARLFNDAAWDAYYNASAGEAVAPVPPESQPASEVPASEIPASEAPAPEEPCPAPVPPCPQPVPPRPASVPVQSEPLHPELALTLSDLQESSRQLAQGFEQMSRELGRISRSMGDQDRRSREVQS